jgi:hypothetical protein
MRKEVDEKLKGASLNKSRFKLFGLNFSIKSVQTSFCEMPKTTQQSLFLLFDYNNCLQTQHQCQAVTECSQSTVY